MKAASFAELGPFSLNPGNSLRFLALAVILRTSYPKRTIILVESLCGKDYLNCRQGRPFHLEFEKCGNFGQADVIAIAVEHMGPERLTGCKLMNE